MLGKIAGPIQWFWRYARKGSNFWYYYHYISSSNMDVYAAAEEEADIVQSISYTQTST